MTGSIALLLLVALLYGMIYPSANNVSAETITATASTNAIMSIKSTVAVNLTPDLSLDVAPQANGTFSTGSANLRVATNNVSGYSVYVSSTGDGKLLPAIDKENTYSIEPVTGSMNAANYQEHLNSWGYANLTDQDLNTVNYQAIPITADAAIISSTEAASDDSYTLGFAFSIGIDLPADVYHGGVMVSAVANPVTITSLTQLTYLQEMTSDICHSTMDYIDKDHYVTKQLVDIRDGKSYWVAKLADGNCWMTQNLALNIGTDYKTKYTNANTDIPANYSWPYFTTSKDNQGYTSITQTSVPAAITTEPSTTTTYSWRLGDWVLADPLNSKDCGDTTNINTCVTKGIIKTTTDDNDKHYALGYYYQWNAATAGSGGNIANKDAVWSLCPSGWRLPAIGTKTSSTPKSFWGLVQSYNFEDESNNLKEPLYLATGGIIDIKNGFLKGVGDAAFYWTSTAWSAAGNAYSFIFSAPNGPSSSNYRNERDGYPIRCVAR